MQKRDDEGKEEGKVANITGNKSTKEVKRSEKSRVSNG